MVQIYGDIGLVLPEKVKLVIPEFDDFKLMTLYERIKPVVEYENKKYFLKELSLDEIKNTAYTWLDEKSLAGEVDISKLIVLDDFLCLHEYGYCGFFKPSVAEVLTQFPDRLQWDASAFEIIESPDTREDVYRYPAIVNSGLHLSKVRVYGTEKRR